MNRRRAAFLIAMGMLAFLGDRVITHYVTGNRPCPFRPDAFEQVVRAAEKGSLKANSSGVITLPDPLAALTCDGKVYVTAAAPHGDGGGPRLYFFPTQPWWWYIPRPVRFYNGYLFSARPLPKADPDQDPWLELNCPPESPVNSFSYKETGRK